MEQLALLGGPKAVTLDYETVGNRPIVNQQGIDAAVELMKKGEISQSQSVFDFEKRFAGFVGAKYAIATNNGTSSLHTALFAVGVGAGDEVIVPSFTFWATMGPIYCQHAVPVFCDVDPATHCIDPADIERKITSKTKAILPVHVWGNPCDMDAIMAIAKRHGIKVVEDASHAHGARYKGKMVGTIGDVGCFSLQGSKLLPAGEGGILVTNSRECFERGLAFGHYDRLPDLPEDSLYRQYALTGMGYKYRAHPVAIALSNSCLDELPERNAIRDGNARKLEELLSDLPWISQPGSYQEAERIFSYQYMYYDKEQLGGIGTLALLKALAAEGVLCGYCGYGRLHQSPLVLQGGPEGDCSPRIEPVSLPVTEHLAQQAFMGAPRFENHCDQLIRQYAAAYHKVAENREALREFERSYDFTEELKNLSGRSVAMIK